MSAEGEVFDAVDNEFLTLLGAINTAMTILEAFDEPKRKLLYDTLQEVISSFRALQRLEPKVTGAVPLRVLKLADEGKNPDELARALIAECHKSARNVQRKHDWMQYLKDSLDVLIDLNFPDDPSRSEADP
jgi:hypothetical protein